jgi:hypothetical protein
MGIIFGLGALLLAWAIFGRGAGAARSAALVMSLIILAPVILVTLFGLIIAAGS